MEDAEENANTTLYESIYARMVREIAAEAYPVGSKLPSEQRLCERFGASRNTIRYALQKLQLAGLIRRRQGSGSVVIALHPPERFVSSVQNIDGLMQYVSETRLEILTTERVLPDSDFQKIRGCQQNEIWLKISALRRKEGAALPIAYTEIFILDRFASVAGAVGRGGLPVYRALEEQFGVHVARVHQSIEAEIADKNLSSRLMIEPGSPVLRISREYIADDHGVVEVAINHHPTARFSYHIFLERG